MGEIKLNLDIEERLKARQREADKQLFELAAKDSEAVRRQKIEYASFRRGFIRDCEAVINLKQFNRYANKTQVFSLLKNNDISNRSYHTQLVSRIARTIGEALGLNLHLIEAIALAHDLGHTPFGHAGEMFLGKLSKGFGYTFKHHYQSARYLNNIGGNNISFQVIDGVLGHNGEKLRKEYIPQKIKKGQEFKILDERMEACYCGKASDEMLTPSTLEGCLVRICDIIAYLGKDRQDAEKLGLIKLDDKDFTATILGDRNRDFIFSISTDIINNSFGKNYIATSEEVFGAIEIIKKENYERIYLTPKVKAQHKSIEKMFAEVFEFLLCDLTKNNAKVLGEVYFAFLDYSGKKETYLKDNINTPERIVCDFIASMCDDYFVSFYNHFKAQNKAWRETVEHTDYFG